MTKYFPTITQYEVPSQGVTQVVKSLREDGDRGNEGVLFFAGTVGDATTRVTTILLPVGTGVVKEPLFCRVSEEVMNAIAARMDPPFTVLLMQIHTHRAFPRHSPTDDMYCFKSPGFVSVVIDNFAVDEPPNPFRWAFHECDSNGRFRLWAPREVRRRVVLVESEIKLVEVNAHGPRAT